MWSVVSESESYDMRNKYENTDFREDLSNHYSTAENINAILCEQGP